MTRRSVTLAELKMMSAAQRKRRMTELVAATRAPSTETIAELKVSLAAWEAAYGMSSEEMGTRVATGALQATNAIHTWLMLVRIYERLLIREEGETRTRSA